MTDDPRYVAPKAHAKLNKPVIIRDSILAECLYSLMVTITIMSCMMIVKLYVVTIDVSMISPYIVMVFALIHTFIRRSGIKKAVINLAVQLAVSVAFYFTAVNISFLGFGTDGRTKFYLIAFIVFLVLAIRAKRRFQQDLSEQAHKQYKGFRIAAYVSGGVTLLMVIIGIVSLVLAMVLWKS